MKNFLEYLINNNLPSLIVSALAFMVSIIGTLIIPWRKNQREKKQLQQELDNFKKMLVEEYLKEFTELIDKFLESKLYLFSDAQSLKEIPEKKITRLKYMLENELIYLSSKNQFKLIRMAEFTLVYFANAHKILEVYSPSLDTVESEELKLKHLKRLTDKYFLNIEKYANLETDYLVSENEIEKIKNEIYSA